MTRPSSPKVSTAMYVSETYNKLIENFWIQFKSEVSDSNKDVERADAVIKILNDCGFMLTCAKYDYLKYVSEGLNSRVKYESEDSQSQDESEEDSDEDDSSETTSTDATTIDDDDDETFCGTSSTSTSSLSSSASSETSSSDLAGDDLDEDNETETSMEEDYMDPEHVTYAELANCFIKKVGNTLKYLAIGEFK